MSKDCFALIITIIVKTKKQQSHYVESKPLESLKSPKIYERWNILGGQKSVSKI